MQKLILLLGLSLPAIALAQQYSVDWHKIAGGGGTSVGTNGASVYAVSGTIGQPDASTASTGGAYAVTGGYWSFLSVVQTAGLPNLTITQTGNNVIVSWPNTGSFTLQQNSTLSATAAWATTAYTVTTNSPAGTNSISISSPTGYLFFRLHNP